MASRRAKGKVGPDTPVLRSVGLRPGVAVDEFSFPFSVPTVRSLPDLEFASPVTLFVGENGSGKSTLLEGIALATRVPAVGSEAASVDDTLDAQRPLAAALRLVWNRRTQRGFFLRAEDFFGFAKSLSRMRAEFKRRLKEIDQEYRDRSTKARGLASLPAATSLADMEGRYGANLDANSHGESFFALMRNRFVPGGLYLLDEPEAALSPQSQLAFIALVKEMVAQQAQFIIATHSPILLAFPGARIVSFDEAPIREVNYDELEHVTLTREFLRNPDAFLRRL
jgi:predicted ATPase